MNALDVMTQPVISVAPHGVHPGGGEADAAEQDQRAAGGRYPGHVVGIVTEGDFLRRAETGTQRRRPTLDRVLCRRRAAWRADVHTSGRKVEDVHRLLDVRTVTEDTPWKIRAPDGALRDQARAGVARSGARRHRHAAEPDAGADQCRHRRAPRLRDRRSHSRAPHGRARQAAVGTASAPSTSRSATGP